MAKELLKDTATVVAERLLQSLMPQLNARLDAIQQQLIDLRVHVEQRFEQIEQRFERVDDRLNQLQQQFDQKIERVDQKFDLKFERQAELINELGLRINTVGTKLDAYVDITRVTQSDVHQFLERIVRVEEANKPRKRRAS